MEKYSSFRDPGTGIQPFLTLVPPPGNEWLTALLKPFGYIFGVVRTLCVIVLALVYFALVQGLCLPLAPIPLIHRIITRAFTSITTRLVLLLVGVVWLRVEYFTRKRGKGSKGAEAWHPRAGDIIISNWVSWIELLWLAFRFDPIFALPIYQNLDSSPNILIKTGQSTGTGSAHNVSKRALRPIIPITGFYQASLLSAVFATGKVPRGTLSQGGEPLDVIRKRANRPIVVFPECTTSNGRGLLRFAQVLQGMDVPVKNCNIFVMCVRFDPPTALSPTGTHSIPSGFLNPLPHLFRLTTAFQPLSVSIRLLAPSESPSSRHFIAKDVIPDHPGSNQLSEICATLIAQMGRLKRTGVGWEDKAELLEFFRQKLRGDESRSPNR